MVKISGDAQTKKTGISTLFFFMTEDSFTMADILDSADYDPFLVDESDKGIDKHSIRRSDTDTRKTFYPRHLLPSKRCKFGDRCMEKAICSFYHGMNNAGNSSLSTDYCDCNSTDCPKPHPQRSKKVVRKRPRETTREAAHIEMLPPFSKCCRRYDCQPTGTGKCRYAPSTVYYF